MIEKTLPRGQAIFARDARGLEEIARRVRIDVLRTVAHAAGGHIGGPLSCVEMLVILYFRVMNIRPEDPAWEDRDRFVLSKGHSSIALYAVMAERGYFPREELATFDRIDSRLQGHPDMTSLPGIDMSTGSLGQGISAAVGMAMGAKVLSKEGLRVYCMVGDGECQEGEVWEAALVGERYRLDNLIVLVDFNKVQQFGAWRRSTPGERVPTFAPDDLSAKWRAFGWRVLEIDGHDFGEILWALARAKEAAGSGVPTCVVAHTVKGKGVSFMEDTTDWHARVPSEAELASALAELGEGGEAGG